MESGWDSFVRVVASIEGGWTSGVLALERFGADSRADQTRFMLFYGGGLHGNGAWPYRRVLRGTLNVAPAWKRPASGPGRHPCHCAPSSLTAR